MNTLLTFLQQPAALSIFLPLSGSLNKKMFANIRNRQPALHLKVPPSPLTVNEDPRTGSRRLDPPKLKQGSCHPWRKYSILRPILESKVTGLFSLGGLQINRIDPPWALTKTPPRISPTFTTHTTPSPSIEGKDQALRSNSFSTLTG